MIDGLDALTAAWHYAGILGLWPAGMSLRRLSMMFEGRSRQKRMETVDQAQLVWRLGDINLLDFVIYGEIEDTDIGGEVELTPEQEQRVRDRVAELRRDNPDLPKVHAG